jgi:hypothetical protein
MTIPKVTLYAKLERTNTTCPVYFSQFSTFCKSTDGFYNIWLSFCGENLK